VFRPLALFPLQAAAAFFSLLNLRFTAVSATLERRRQPPGHTSEQSWERTFDDAEGRQSR